MKISELLQEKVKKSMIGKIPVKTLSQRIIFNEKTLKKDFLGSGLFANVYKKPKDSNTVIKIAKIKNLENDTTVKYVNEILEHPNNPFFPRIYKAKIYIIPHNPTLLFLEMEKLHRLNQKILKHNIDPIFESLGITKELIKKSYRLQKIQKDYDRSPSDMIYSIFREPKLIKELIENSPNPQFQQALSIIKSTGGYMDLHIENFMYRLTSIGPQLVLTDPVT